MRNDDIQLVRKIPLFSTLSDEHFDDLLAMAYLQSFPPHVQTIEEGDPAEFLHILVEGTVEMFGSTVDRETTVFVLRSGSTFNLSAVLEDSNYLLSARTLEKSRILMVPGTHLRQVMRVSPGFAHTMATELAKRYRVLVRAFKEERLRTGVERLANYLLCANEQAMKSGHIELSENKRKLAALLGMTPEYLSRAFIKLKKCGVEVSGNKIQLKNLDALRQVAKPNPLLDRRKI